MQDSPSNDGRPAGVADGVAVSVVVPMLDEAAFIRACLDSLLSNRVEGGFEVLVVDGGSTDGSREVVRDVAERVAAAGRHPAPVRLLDNPKRIAAAAMNVGIRAARGRYVVRADAHSEYPPGHLATCIAELERTGADNVGGVWDTRPGADTLVANAIALMTRHPFGVGNSWFRLGRGGRDADTVPFGAFRRELFDRIGPYREDLARHEDFELNARIRSAGGRVYLSDRIRNVYYNVPTFGRLARQAWGNGVWNARTWVRYPASFAWRHAVPLVFVGAIVACGALGFAAPAAWTVLCGAGTAYAGLMSLSTAQVCASSGPRYAAVLPLLFPAFHVTYGVATAWGLAGALAERLSCRRPPRGPGGAAR